MWVNLENIMLSKWSQTQKVTYFMTPFLRNVRRDRSTATEVALWLPGAEGDGTMVVIANGWKVSLGDDENVLKLSSSDDLLPVSMVKPTEWCTFKS